MSTASRFDVRLVAGVAAGKLSGQAIRLLGRGGGTAAPGLIANLIEPNILDKLTGKVRGGRIVVAGTNGKTTTSRMLANILDAADLQVIHNRSGSNLVRGISAAFAAQSSWTGLPRGDIAVIESDEAAFPDIVRRVNPRLILLLNLFRDQLDRYGELDTIARHWRETFETLRPDQTLLVNGDDPALVAITEDLPAQRLLFGIKESRYLLPELPHAVDSALCRRCGAPLRYTQLFLSHLGEYVCDNCGFHRPGLDFAASDITLHGLDSVSLKLVHAEDVIDFSVAIPGLYNAYNAVAAASAALTIGVAPRLVTKTLGAFRSAFGRIERLSYRGRELVIVLIKNPVGFDEVLRMLAVGGLREPTLIVINDLDADGRDVSWLWDVNVEQLADGSSALYTSGLRGPDMAVRLKYAGIASERIHPLGDLPASFDQFVDAIPAGTTGYILPTYTAMLQLRQMLVQRGAVAAFWEQ
ncbi:MAG TPA: MurT ligase domain-containing protein [Nitrolancea sp.]|nr:MurT ligase domain-containing protein [Nitrolancea sp.]